MFYLNISNPVPCSDWNAITTPLRACAGDHVSCVSTFSDDVIHHIAEAELRHAAGQFIIHSLSITINIKIKWVHRHIGCI